MTQRKSVHRYKSFVRAVSDSKISVLKEDSQDEDRQFLYTVDTYIPPERRHIPKDSYIPEYRYKNIKFRKGGS